MNTPLNDRILWFDGTIQVTPDMVPSLLLLGILPNQLASTGENVDLQKFNLFAESNEQISLNKTSNNQFDFSWQLPLKYKELSVEEVLIQKFENSKFVADDRYIQRLAEEMVEISARGLENLFRSLIYIIDTFKEHNIVWGVGRGSSCASFALYLIDLHKVDPVKYNIPLSEFFHA